MLDTGRYESYSLQTGEYEHDYLEHCRYKEGSGKVCRKEYSHMNAYRTEFTRIKRDKRLGDTWKAVVTFACSTAERLTVLVRTQQTVVSQLYSLQSMRLDMKLSQYIHNRVATAAMRRNWSELPTDFERDAVRHCYKNHVGVLLDRRDIAARIKASKAQTFEELTAAVDSIRFDAELCTPE